MAGCEGLAQQARVRFKHLGPTADWTSACAICSTSLGWAILSFQLIALFCTLLPFVVELVQGVVAARSKRRMPTSAGPPGVEPHDPLPVMQNGGRSGNGALHPEPAAPAASEPATAAAAAAPPAVAAV